MPGTILLEDAQKLYTERLQQHAQDAFQAVQQANEPPLRNTGAPSLPNPQIDPNVIVQNLQQHAQDAWQAVQQANQPPLQGVQIDPNDITQRLQQHAQDAFQAVDQSVQPISQGFQQAAQPAVQAAQTTAQNVGQAAQDANQPPFQNQNQNQNVQPSASPDRSMSLQDYARAAARRAGIDPDIFVAQIQQESGFSPTAKSPAGAIGIAQFMPDTAKGVGVDPTDPYAALDAAAQLDAQNLAKYGGDYSKALAAYNAGGGNVDKYGGVPPFQETQNYVKTILGNAKQAVGNVVEAGKQAATGALGQISQFGDKQLTAAEAYAACGPAAAVRFAQMYGRNPTLREATDLAQGVGWTAEQGMAGLQSESKLFTEMGIPHRVVGADWQALAREAQSGNPVTISTTGHYFTADSYDPRSGAFHVGSSGTDLKGGSEWMTPEQMQAAMGPLQGGLAADNPGTPAPSPISGAVQQAQQLVQQGGRAIQGGLQQVDRAVQGAVSGGTQAIGGVAGAAGGLASDFGSRARQVAQGAQDATSVQSMAANPLMPSNILGGAEQAAGNAIRPAVGYVASGQAKQDLAEELERQSSQSPLGPTIPGPVQEVGLKAAAGFLRQPSVLDQMQIMQDLMQKYGNRPDPDSMTPEDRARWNNAQLAVAGTIAEPGIGAEATRMFHGTGSAFERPGQFSDQSLYGPGYYLTSNPDVAGGAVSRGRFGIDPATGRTSTYNPETGKFDTYMTGRGELVSPGYAQARPNLSMADVQSVAQRAADEADQNPGYYGRSVGSDLRDLARRLPDVPGISTPQDAEQQVFAILSRDSPNPESLVKKLAPDIYGRGGNVRAVDVPQNLDLLDAEKQISPDTLQRVADALDSRFGQDEGRNYLLNARTQGAQNWTGETLVQTLRSYLRDIPGQSLAWPTDQAPAMVNKVLADAGFDGISYAGGKRIPMTDEFGTPIEHQATVVFPESLDKVRNAISGRQGGAASPQFATTLGGGVAGGVAGNVATPENATPEERARNIGLGAVAGLGAGAAAAHPAQVGNFLRDESGALKLGGGIDQQILQNLREAGVVPGTRGGMPPPPPPGSAERMDWLTGRGRWAPVQTTRGPIARGVDITKESILSNPATHIANVIGNTIELARQPLGLALGGRPQDAMAGITAVGRAIPEAAQNAMAALRGNQLANLSNQASSGGGPIFRALGASDAFTRTLGEYQGMAAEANRLLRQAGIAADDPAAAGYLARHAAELYTEGARAGAQSVFGRVATEGQGTGVLDNIFRSYSNAKEGFLSSPRLRDQAVGALMDFGIPFSGVPVQMLQIGLNRLPVTAQASGAVRAIRAMRAGNMGQAQRAIGDTVLESAIQLMIAKNVADGNINGPDDPDHPNSVRIGGNWVSMNEWGAYALPMQIMASFADGYEKGGQDVPAGSSVPEYYGPRFAAALNASLKPFQQGIPGENLIRLVSNIGQGGATAGALGLAQDAVNRITVPGAARFIENLSDPVARDINRKGVESLWQGTMANWPGLAQQLPAKIDPTTGEVLNKARTGAGILVGGQQDVESPITVEANRLKKAGFAINPPKVYPQAVTIAGAQVKLSPDEQRAVTAITGKLLGNFADRLNTPDYQKSTDNRKAQLMQSYLNAADRARASAVRQVLGQPELRRRVLAGQTTVGRLNAQAAAPEIPFLSSSSLSAQEQQQLAGVGA